MQLVIVVSCCFGEAAAGVRHDHAGKTVEMKGTDVPPGGISD